MKNRKWCDYHIKFRWGRFVCNLERRHVFSLTFVGHLRGKDLQYFSFLQQYFDVFSFSESWLLMAIREILMVLMGIWMVSGWVDASKGDCGCEFTGKFTKDHRPIVRGLSNNCKLCFEPRSKTVYHGIKSGTDGYKISCKCVCVFESSYCARIGWAQIHNNWHEWSLYYIKCSNTLRIKKIFHNISWYPYHI